MPVELKVPEVGESITEVHIGQWRKQVGQRAEKDENLVELESDKATVDLPAPVSGTLTQILKQPGEVARVGEVIGYMAAGAEAGTAPAPQALKPTTVTPVPAVSPVSAARPTVEAMSSPFPKAGKQTRIMPAAERLMAQEKIHPEAVTPTGPGGRILKEDVQRATEQAGHAAPPASAATVAQAPAAPQAPPVSQPVQPQFRGEIVPADLSRGQSKTDFAPAAYPREEEMVVMSPIRRRIAERLVEAQHSAALLTTFNEVDMTEVIALRSKHREQYEQQYGVKLGFMSFFVKAAVEALKHVPQLNAEVRNPHIVYHNYYDIGIAVGGGKGLVVPVLRNAEFMSFAEVEQKIADFGRRAKENKLKLEELQGGTFTISNGGIYGSMLSTPIVNPPQSGILGLHAIQDRPAVHNGQVVVRPMMYVALTYDHRIVDGREAVLFLKRIKETIEEPTRILLEI
ncbi:MAG TPA: 2-oxoglutarate dehydrogenase complex dihydrolipoyllysine-residue succinyltransferase [Pirellulales bacterium]|jgi:2-oxoglutarate dehydrogenase E2 component (dihydrolipoamide succinyltransferase)|nr:2-oxoglutarate dehydrogenase complex dihydrolipoyllysine-residue succinyltransferase [Pirellulales bacterium]